MSDFYPAATPFGDTVVIALAELALVYHCAGAHGAKRVTDICWRCSERELHTHPQTILVR